MAERVLVTGGAGFIGSFLVDALVDSGAEVLILDCLDGQVHPGGKKPDYLNGKAEFTLGDVRDGKVVKEVLRGVGIVFHLAAAVGVGQSQYEISRYVESNVQGTANLLDALVNEKNDVKKLVVASSMSAYGEGAYLCVEHGSVRPPLRSEEQLKSGDWEMRCTFCDRTVRPVATSESLARNANSVYALTKKTQEDLCMIVGGLYGISTTALRFFNVHGPRQSLSNPYTGVAAIFMSRIKNGKPPLIFEDGGQSRDFISVHDVVRALIMSMENPIAGGKVYNVGTGKPVTIAEVARVIARLSESDIAPEITNRFRKGDVRHCHADISKIRSELGFEPQVSFEEGMSELIDWASSAVADDRVDAALRELEEKKLV